MFIDQSEPKSFLLKDGHDVTGGFILKQFK
jgi:hypothetical protein